MKILREVGRNKEKKNKKEQKTTKLQRVHAYRSLMKI